MYLQASTAADSEIGMLPLPVILTQKEQCIVKRMAELIPSWRSLQSRTAHIRGALGPAAARIKAAAHTRGFAAICYLAAALVVVSAAALNLRLVQVQDDVNPPKYILTQRNDPKQVLSLCGVTLNDDDTYDFSGFQNNYGKIKIYRAFPVSITADNKTNIIHIAKGTVEDALQKSKVPLGKDDLINLSLNAPVSDGTSIRIQRVAYQTVVQQQTVTCSLDQKETPLLATGKTVVIDPGKNGQNSITLVQKFIDGVKTEEREVNRRLTAEPVKGTVLVGTAKNTPVSRLEPGGLLLTSRGEPTRYGKCLVGKATAYTAKKNSGTASGRRAAVGVVAVNPKLIPYGTRLYITSADGSFVYGNAVAGDTGGFISNGSGVLVDLYFNTQKEVGLFGSRSVKIYVLE